MQEYNEQQEDSSAESCSRSLLRQQVLHAYTDLHRQKTLASLPQTTGMLRSGDAGAARALHAALRSVTRPCPLLLAAARLVTVASPYFTRYNAAIHVMYCLTPRRGMCEQAQWWKTIGT